MYAVIEMAKDGLFEQARFATKEEAQNHKDDLVSTWTHWSVPGCPCQKNFEVFEVA